LAELGESRLKVTGPVPGERFGMLATRSDKQIQLLVYNFNEQNDQFKKKDEIEIHLEGLPASRKVTINEI